MADGIKKPSLKDAGNKGLYGYLGHFAQDKYIAMGHNDTGDSLRLNAREAERDDVKSGNLTDDEKEAAAEEATFAAAKAQQAKDDAAAATPEARAAAYINAPMAH